MMNKLDSSLVIVEQGEMWRTQSELQNTGIGVEMGDGTKITDDYERVDIGPGTDYPTMMTIVIPIMRELGKTPQLKSFTPGTTGKSFIKDVKAFKKGDLLSDGSPAPEGQEYIVNNDYKLCLPSKKWWDEHTNNNYVYQFKNPKNGKTFNLKLNLSKGDIVVNDKKVKAIYALLEEDIADKTDSGDHWSDPEFVAEMNRRANEMESGKVKGRSWEEVHKSVRQKAKSK